MPLQVIPILRALALLAPHASGIVSSIRALGGTSKNEERIATLEEELLRTGEVLVGLTEQLKAVAEGLRLQEELNEAREWKLKYLQIACIFSAAVGVISLCISLAR